MVDEMAGSEVRRVESVEKGMKKKEREEGGDGGSLPSLTSLPGRVLAAEIWVQRRFTKYRKLGLPFGSPCEKLIHWLSEVIFDSVDGF